ncbi:MAG TPA: glycosyltransferase family 4 protein [Pyrinomonadaceae bacterium]
MIKNNNTEDASVLGLFPYFGPDAVGGVQASARIAWSAVKARANGSSNLLVYATDKQTAAATNGGDAVIVNSKSKAIYKALSSRWSQDLVFVWHLGLLRLLPFLRLSGVRVVVMLLGIEAWKEQRGLTRKQLDKVDLFLTISDHTWRSFVACNAQFAGKPHLTVLLGIGEPLTGKAPAPSGPPAALILSRLSKAEDYKGHREVIRAWPRVVQRTPDAELWIVGDGDLRNDLERLVAELHLEKQVRFCGLVSDETKQELLQKSRCLVMPSRAEGFGLVYLEAMRLGRPCLVSTLDAGREVVNPPEAGLAVHPDDAAELTDSICRLLGDGAEWQRWSDQARRRYEANFTAKHFQQRLLSALFQDART